jgi:hypothetical protein
VARPPTHHATLASARGPEIRPRIRVPQATIRLHRAGTRRPRTPARENHSTPLADVEWPCRSARAAGVVLALGAVVSGRRGSGPRPDGFASDQGPACLTDYLKFVMRTRASGQRGGEEGASPQVRLASGESRKLMIVKKPAPSVSSAPSPSYPRYME